MKASTRHALAALIGAVVGLPAGIGVFHMTHQPPPAIEPAPISTERAPHCFDGTLERGCPDFSITPPRPIKSVTVTEDGYLIEYEDK